MAQQKIVTNNFSGGMSDVSEKSGIKNSAQFIQNLDIFEDPNYITLSKGASKISSTTVDDLVRWLVDASPWNTSRYAYDESGAIYEIDNNDSVTKLQTTSGSSGEGLAVRDNYLYYAQDTDIGRYGQLDNSPSFVDSFDTWADSTDLEQSGGSTGNTYNTLTSINDSLAIHQQTIGDSDNKIDFDPIKSITINVDTVGSSADWTLTVHDSNDNEIGAKTILNANMSTGDVAFTFDTPLRVDIGQTYHFHVTTSNTTGTPAVNTGTSSDLEHAEYTVSFGILISAEFHPIQPFFEKLVIGNERYLASFDFTSFTYSPNKLILPPGFKVRSLTKVNEFIVGDAWSGQSLSEAERVVRFSWDGIAPTFNFFEELDTGAVNASMHYRNEMVSIIGNRGSLYSGIEQLTKHTDGINTLSRGKILEVYPGAIAEYNERILFGVSASTDDSNLEQGVYEFGSQDSDLPVVLSYPYLISTGTTTGTTLKVGALAAFGTDLYISFRDGDDYGIDKVASGDNASSETGTWESRIFDAGDPDAHMQAVKVEVTFEALASGESVTPKYKIDRDSSFTTGDTVSTTGATRAVVHINKLCKEIEFGFNVDSSSNTFPIITSVILHYDDLSDEESAI